MSKTESWTDIVTNELAIVVYLRSKNIIEEYKLKDENTLGRSTNGLALDIAIDSPVVSRKHGRIYLHEDYYFYEDLSSTNGTYINGELYGRESSNAKYKNLLKIGDVLRIDHRDLSNPHPNAVILVAIHDSGDKIISKDIDLKKCKSLTIGRDTGDVKLDNKAISEKHAIFMKNEDDSWSVDDCDSTNGVFVNNSKIEGNTRLKLLDVIRIADYVFIYTGDKLCYFCNEQLGKQLVIKIEERSVRKLLKKQILLQNINLRINEGEMVMILGGSGAGKTTFVNAILGYEKAKGTIEHDNINIYKEYSKVRSNMGFVPQQDLLRLEDTVYATLSNAAEMKMDSKTTKQERESRIEHVINSLGLARERDSVVKKLSGGQRKRLSIALELVSNPSLFFLDEPDSGLDGIMAKSLMEQLRVIANEGKIVMVITHAPDRVRDLFDKVVILAKGEKDNIGHLAFFGSIPEAFEFFDTTSLEGVVKKINRVDEGGDGLSDYYIEKYSKNQKGSL
ncbi:MAG: ATP-binding cassette domain-containing protein [Lachnospiraceae bacterium]|nr:ATP-binding cassette domain-containing protein [Lachnospiraceae bacterium]